MSFLSRHSWFTLLLLIIAATASYAQDTTKTLTGSPSQPRQSRPGFDLPDSLYRIGDTLGTAGGIDTIVQYTAKDSIVFDVNGRRMILVNDATMNFQGRSLNAYTIVVDFNNSTLTAYSDDYDSVIENSLSRRRRIIRDTNRVASRGAPILREGDTPYEGEIIVYNFKTRKGTVQLGTSTMEGGFYYGERIKQVDRNTLFVQNGRFTTCDAPIPHYYFESPKMKVEMRDKVFAAPVYLFISDVPIFALPFGLFPNHGGGRRSGIIAPNYQTGGDRGFGLVNLGYYQVFSDYFDAAVKASIYTKGGYDADLRASYMRRYWLSGPASFVLGYGFTRKNEDDPFKKVWNGEFRIPDLILGLTTRLNANLTFRSSGYSESTAENINDLLDQSTTSRASFSTNWEDAGISLDIGYSRNQDLIRDTYEETSPSFNVRKSTFFPFAPGADAEEGASNPLQTLAIDYSMNAQRQLNRTRPNDSTFERVERYGVLHSPSISISPKLGYFGITPSIGYGEAWFFRTLKRTARLDDTNVVFDDVIEPGFNRVHRYDFGLNVETRLIGIANIGILGVNAIRHIVSPSVNLSYRPDFSDQQIGTFQDPRNGRIVEYNIFERDINGTFASGRESGTISFGLSNNFEAKINRAITEDSVTEEKVKLLDVGINSGYDVIQNLFSNVSLTASSAIGSFLSMNADASFTLYPRVPVLDADSSLRTYFSLGRGLLRPLSARLSLSGNFTSKSGPDGENVDSLRRLFNVETPEDERALLIGGVFPGAFVYIPFRPTWNIGYSFSYTEDYIDLETRRNLSGYASLTLALTRNWSISTGASYDFVNKKVLVPNIRVTRDLHCWEMNFDYRPTGTFRGFNFEIRIKAEQLRDVKLTRTENSFGQF